jgi:hypothetical protein
MDREAQSRRESRDGIVWEHLPDQRLCRVKVQGSNELVVAWYPENWERKPVYLKPGNAVRIAHVGGVRNRIEIVGHGLTIPSPVAGGILPDMGAGSNYWVSGGGLLATETESLRVRVLPGVLRISGVNYDLTFDPVMGDPMEMGDGLVIGSGTGIMEIDAPPDFIDTEWGTDIAQFRYDAFAVGADGVVDYIKGTETVGTSGPPSYNPVLPVKPSIPGDHVIAGDYILVHSGMTQIVQSDIGRIFSQPRPFRLEMNIATPTMTIHPPNHRIPPPYYPVPVPTNTAVELRMVDQYGNPAPRPGGGNYLYHFSFIGWQEGNGVIGQPSITGATLYPTTEEMTREAGWAYTFVYERAGAEEGYSYDPADPENTAGPNDLTPGLLGYVEYNGVNYYASGRVVLLDHNGGYMPPDLVLGGVL